MRSLQVGPGSSNSVPQGIPMSCLMSWWTDFSNLTGGQPLDQINGPPVLRGTRRYRTSAATHMAPNRWANRSSDQPRSLTKRCHSVPSMVAASRSRVPLMLTIRPSFSLLAQRRKARHASHSRPGVRISKPDSDPESHSTESRRTAREHQCHLACARARARSQTQSTAPGPPRSN